MYLYTLLNNNIDGNKIKYLLITHSHLDRFPHNGDPIHHRVEEFVKDRGYLVSYDGISIEI